MMVTTTPVLKHYVIVTILFNFRLGAVHDGDNNACSKTLVIVTILFNFRLGAVHDGDNNACSKTLRYSNYTI